MNHNIVLVLSMFFFLNLSPMKKNIRWTQEKPGEKKVRVSIAQSKYKSLLGHMRLPNVNSNPEVSNKPKAAQYGVDTHSPKIGNVEKPPQPTLESMENSFKIPVSKEENPILVVAGSLVTPSNDTTLKEEPELQGDIIPDETIQNFLKELDGYLKEGRSLTR